MVMSLLLTAIWASLAALSGRVPAHLQGELFWGLVLTGIPLLGVQTFLLGPWWGLGLLLAGILFLRWPGTEAEGPSGQAPHGDPPKLPPGE